MTTRPVVFSLELRATICDWRPGIRYGKNTLSGYFEPWLCRFRGVLFHLIAISGVKNETSLLAFHCKVKRK
jgi:hypothetical protein